MILTKHELYGGGRLVDFQGHLVDFQGLPQGPDLGPLTCTRRIC